MKETTVSLAQAGLASEAVLPARVQEALGRAGRRGEGGAARAERRCRARRARRADGRGSRRGRRAEGQARSRTRRGAPRPRGRRGDARRAARRGCERPRVRSADGRSEVPLATYAHFADRDPLTKAVLERMLAGVSTRRYRRTQEPVGSEVEAAGAVDVEARRSRASFVERTRAIARRADEPPPRRRPAGGDDDRRDRAAGPHATWSRSGSRPRASRSRSGSGKARPRTRPSRPRCSPTWSSAASTPSRGSCS